MILWTGSTSDSGYLSDGLGEEGSPYIISTADQLVHLIRNCDSSAGKYYQLKEGVDFYLSDIKGLSGNELTTALQNASYSYNAKTFSGVLDGNGCTIYGLTRGSQYFGNLGLFGAIDGATIKNLKIENAYISNQRAADNSKNGVLAVLAATANGACTIENVSVVDSTVLGDSYAGGLIGIQNGTVAVNNVIVANVALTGTNKNALCGKSFETPLLCKRSGGYKISCGRRINEYGHCYGKYFLGGCISRNDRRKACFYGEMHPPGSGNFVTKIVPGEHWYGNN